MIACPTRRSHCSAGRPVDRRTLRTAGYAYSVYFTSDGSDADWELYDVSTNPNEDNDVAGTTQYGIIQATLDDELQQAMTDSGTMP